MSSGLDALLRKIAPALSESAKQQIRSNIYSLKEVDSSGKIEIENNEVRWEGSVVVQKGKTQQYYLVPIRIFVNPLIFATRDRTPAPRVYLVDKPDRTGTAFDNSGQVNLLQLSAWNRIPDRKLSSLCLKIVRGIELLQPYANIEKYQREYASRRRKGISEIGEALREAKMINHISELCAQKKVELGKLLENQEKEMRSRVQNFKTRNYGPDAEKLAFRLTTDKCLQKLRAGEVSLSDFVPAMQKLSYNYFTNVLLKNNDV